MKLEDFKDQVAREFAEGTIYPWQKWDDMMMDFVSRTLQNHLSDRAAELYAKERDKELKVKYFNAGANYGYTAGQYDSSSGHDRRKITGPINQSSENIDKILES